MYLESLFEAILVTWIHCCPRNKAKPKIEHHRRWVRKSQSLIEFRSENLLLLLYEKIWESKETNEWVDWKNHLPKICWHHTFQEGESWGLWCSLAGFQRDFSNFGFLSIPCSSVDSQHFSFWHKYQRVSLRTTWWGFRPKTHSSPQKSYLQKSFSQIQAKLLPSFIVHPPWSQVQVFLIQS